MPESRDKGRSRFEEVAKLATLSETSTGLADDAEENSGMINLAAIAAGAPFARAASRNPVPPERGQRLLDPPDAPSSSPMVLPPPSTPRTPASQATRQAPIDAVTGLTARFPSASLLLQQLDAAALPPPGRVPGFDRGLPARNVANEVAASRPGSGPRLSSPLPPIARPSLSPTSTPLSVETTRPTVMASEAAPQSGGRVFGLALAAGMCVGGLVVLAVILHMRSTSSALAARVFTPTPAETASSSSPGRPSPGSSTATPDERGSAPRVEIEPRSVEPATLPIAPPLAAPSPAPVGAPTTRSAPIAVRATPPPAAAAAAGPASPSTTSPTPAAEPAPAATAPAGATDPGEQSLEALMRKAVGATAKTAPPVPPAPVAAVTEAPKAAPGGNLPQKPAMGAVQGALGAVLPATRYCLGPDDPISHATITFKSDGSVQSVSVTGNAAGQPSEACIRSRLMTTRVPPFSNPTFTWTVTVRPAT